MAGNEAILDLGWAQVQAQHIGDLAAPVLAARAWTTLGPPVPQTRDQVLAQAATGHGVERGVDGLVRHSLARVIRPRALESAGDLLGRPALVQIILHDGEQRGIGSELWASSRLLAQDQSPFAGQ